MQTTGRLIISTLAQAGYGLSEQELAQRTNQPITSVHDSLVELQQESAVISASGNGKGRLFWLANGGL